MAPSRRPAPPWPALGEHSASAATVGNAQLAAMIRPGYGRHVGPSASGSGVFCLRGDLAHPLRIDAATFPRYMFLVAGTPAEKEAAEG